MRLSATIPLSTRQLAANGRSGHTQAAYERDLRALERWLDEDAEISAITPDHLSGATAAPARLLGEFNLSHLMISTHPVFDSTPPNKPQHNCRSQTCRAEYHGHNHDLIARSNKW